jgi:amidase
VSWVTNDAFSWLSLRLTLSYISSPTQASPALPHNASAKVSGLCASTCIFNVLEYPVACLPVTQVDSKLDAHVKGDSAEYNEWKSDKDAHRGSGLLNKALYEQGIYDARKMAGLPVGLQVVSKGLQLGV